MPRTVMQTNHLHLCKKNITRSDATSKFDFYLFDSQDELLILDPNVKIYFLFNTQDTDDFNLNNAEIKMNIHDILEALAHTAIKNKNSFTDLNNLLVQKFNVHNKDEQLVCLVSYDYITEHTLGIFIEMQPEALRNCCSILNFSQPSRTPRLPVLGHCPALANHRASATRTKQDSLLPAIPIRPATTVRKMN